MSAGDSHPAKSRVPLLESNGLVPMRKHEDTWITGHLKENTDTWDHIPS